MSEVWLYLKKSLHCKPQSSEVYVPEANTHHKRENGLNHSNKKLSSPEYLADNVMLNHVSHEIVVDSKSGEIKICPCYPNSKSIEDRKGVDRSIKGIIASTKTHCVDCDECCIFSKPKVKVIKDCNVDLPATTFPLDTIEENDISEHSGKDQYFFLHELIRMSLRCSINSLFFSQFFLCLIFFLLDAY